MGRSRSHTRRTARSLARGTIMVHAQGFAFARTPEGEFYIPASRLAGAFDGDVVEVAPLGAHASKAARQGDRHRAAGRPAARVVRVVERAHERLIGRYEVADPFGVVVPEDPRIPYDIFTQRAEAPDVPDGALVRVRICTYPSRHAAATGVVEEVLGEAGEPCAVADVAAASIVAHHNIQVRFSDEALAQARRARLDADAALSGGYADVRKRCAFTIDPDDARDFDDALSLEPADGADGADAEAARAEAEAASADAEAASGHAEAARVDAEARRRPCIRCAGWEGAGRAVWRLGVHIADVSAYAPWGSALEADARIRATSVYLADRVVPMLPEELSADLCSLRPHEDRLCMTVDLYLDDQARLARYDVYPAVMRSQARLTYGQADEALDEPDRAASALGVEDPLASGIASRLRQLSRIAKLRCSRRIASGGIEFPSTEAKVRFDGSGAVAGVDLRVKTSATSLVEEAMVLANEAVARCLLACESPGLFRVHEPPAADALAGLVPVLAEFPWFERIDRAAFCQGSSAAIQQALAACERRPERDLVGTLLLRSMRRAVYKPRCEGHYGLASEAYTHFTSPIRRYPDLVVHHMLKALLFGRPELFDQEVSSLDLLARNASERERAAEAAARESQEFMLITLLEDQVGSAFSGVVSGVAPYGLYVRLPNTAEGLLPVRMLGGEYYSYDAERHRLVGSDTGRTWRLGQRVAVVLARADARRRTVGLRLAGERDGNGRNG